MHLVLLNFLCMQACVAGIRISASWLVLQQGRTSWELGILLSSSSALSIFTAVYSGRFSQKYGYSRAIVLSVALVLISILIASLSSYVRGQFFMLCLAVAIAGGASNLSLISSQRETGRQAMNSKQRIKLFSLLGLAPSLGLALGSMYGGLLMDWAIPEYVFPLLSLWLLGCLFLPSFSGGDPIKYSATRFGIFDLLHNADFRNLMFANWILNGCWDLYHLAIPVLGHERGYSASKIGVILSAFAAGVLTIRFVMFLRVSHAFDGKLVRLMLMGACILLVFPLAQMTWMLGILSFLLGVVLGATQPILMANLYEIAPADRQGQALALRSIGINLAAAITPSIFGMMAAWGVASAFWGMAGVSILGSRFAMSPRR